MGGPGGEIGTKNSGTRTQFGVREVGLEGFASRNGILGSTMNEVTGDGVGGVDNVRKSAGCWMVVVIAEIEGNH